ncbi:TetR/AcrR family transcriptional regulator [soil metagenome]
MDAPVVDATQILTENENERAYGRPEKQAAILDAATTVFLREGYERASVDTIAAVANVSKRTIYNHFSDKKELFLAAIDRSRTRSEIETAITESMFDVEDGPVEQRVIETGEKLLRGFLDPESMMFRRVVTAELFRYPELKMACVEASSPRRMRARLIHRIEEGNRTGVLDIPNPTVAAEQYLALILYGMNMESAYGTVELSDEKITEIAKNTADIFLRAYTKR